MRVTQAIWLSPYRDLGIRDDFCGGLRALRDRQWNLEAIRHGKGSESGQNKTRTITQNWMEMHYRETTSVVTMQEMGRLAQRLEHPVYTDQIYR